MKRTRLVLGLISLSVLSACGVQHDFDRAKKLEKKGQYYEAWGAYQEFAANHVNDPKAPEALFQAGLLAQTHTGDCYMASTFFDRVIVKYPQSEPWASAALNQKESCPDYFPLRSGLQWVYGDSDTNGRNARIEVSCQAVESTSGATPTPAGWLTKTYFAGTKKFDTKKFYERKQHSELQEMLGPDEAEYKLLLKWPLSVGATWSSKWEKQIWKMDVVALDVPVKVSAGEFEHCLKVKISIEGSPATKFDYYAPNVGFVLTTQLASDGQEKRIVELLRHGGKP